MIQLKSHYLETPPRSIQPFYDKLDHSRQKTALWNAFVDSELSGVNDDDCAILPRILPGETLPIIVKTSRLLTEFALKLLNLPINEIKNIFPSSPIRDFLIEELEVLKFRPNRLVGSFRFDMAIVGNPSKTNPPKLLELNEIGFDGLFRSSFIQNIMMDLLPELRAKTYALDNATAEICNMLRLGKTLARVQYGSYNWEEEVLANRAKSLGLNLKLILPEQFKSPFYKEDYPLLEHVRVGFQNRKLKLGPTQKADAVQMGYSFEVKDYRSDREFYKKLNQAQVPQYGSFLTGLVASKMILVLLTDATLRRRILGSVHALKESILPAYPLNQDEAGTLKNYRSLVLKHADGLGGEMVFMNQELLKWLSKIPASQRAHWVVQQKTKLNTIRVRGILSPPRRVITDLGVFVQYDYSQGKFNHFGVGGFISRATNKSYKVNVSGGGLQVPVMFTKK